MIILCIHTKEKSYKEENRCYEDDLGAKIIWLFHYFMNSIILSIYLFLTSKQTHKNSFVLNILRISIFHDLTRGDHSDSLSKEFAKGLVALRSLQKFIMF